MERRPRSIGGTSAAQQARLRNPAARAGRLLLCSTLDALAGALRRHARQAGLLHSQLQRRGGCGWPPLSPPVPRCPPFNLLPAPLPPQDPEFPAGELLRHSADSKGWCSPRCGRRRWCPLPFTAATRARLAPLILTLPHNPPRRRFSQYPQEITLALEAPARLHTLQLLSHEFKIAARVELLVDEAGAAADTGKPPVFKRLGFLNFDSNERSQFTARELKSVSLTGTVARYVRLVFHKCHANAANLYSQARCAVCCMLCAVCIPMPR